MSRRSSAPFASPPYSLVISAARADDPAPAPAAPHPRSAPPLPLPRPPHRRRRASPPMAFPGGADREADGTSLYFYRTNFVKPLELVTTMNTLLQLPGREAQGLPPPEPGPDRGDARRHRDRARGDRLLRHPRPAGLRRGEDHRGHLREQLRVRLLVGPRPRRERAEHVLPRRARARSIRRRSSSRSSPATCPSRGRASRSASSARRPRSSARST